MAKEDLRAIGLSLSVDFKGDKNNSFNMLSKESRKEWREGRGSLLMGGDLVDGRPVGEGV